MAKAARRSALARGLSMLQVLAITTSTLFENWVNRHGLRLPQSTQLWTKADLQKLDQITTDYLDVLFHRGMAANQGSWLLASLAFHFPVLKTPGSMPGSRRAVTGWTRRHPPKSRSPLPWICLAGIVAEMLAAGQLLAALGTLLMFTLYLRPGEMVDCRVADMLAPTQGLGKGYAFWSFLIRPYEMGRPAKNRVFDQRVPLDRSELQWVNRILRIIKDSAPGERTVMNMTQEQYNGIFREASVKAGRQPLNPVPYMCRRGGDGYYAQTEMRSSLEAHENTSCSVVNCLGCQKPH